MGQAGAKSARDMAGGIEREVDFHAPVEDDQPGRDLDIAIRVLVRHAIPDSHWWSRVYGSCVFVYT